MIFEAGTVFVLLNYLSGLYTLPLLAPSGPLRIVHSSMVPKGANSCLTSSSVCCLLSMPTNSFLSATTKTNWTLETVYKDTQNLNT